MVIFVAVVACSYILLSVTVVSGRTLLLVVACCCMWLLLVVVECGSCINLCTGATVHHPLPQTGQ